MEYLVSEHIIRHCVDISGPTVEAFTHFITSSGEYLKSVQEMNKVQRHGDFMDLQLHWGFHFELKSTTVDADGYLNKTKFWNPSNGKSSRRKEFTCPFYIIAELQEPPNSLEQAVCFNNVVFYIISGEDLDKIPTTKKGAVSYSDIFKNPSTHESNYHDLPSILTKMARDRLAKVREKLHPTGWKMPTMSFPNDMPLALGLGGRVTTAFYNQDSGEHFTDIIQPAWISEEPITWRDWQAVGFHYAEQPVPHPKQLDTLMKLLHPFDYLMCIQESARDGEGTVLDSLVIVDLHRCKIVNRWIRSAPEGDVVSDSDETLQEVGNFIAHYKSIAFAAWGSVTSELQSTLANHDASSAQCVSCYDFKSWYGQIFGGDTQDLDDALKYLNLLPGKGGHQQNRVAENLALLVTNIIY